MPGTVLTVASGKGGVGKTTTAVNLAVALWREGNAVAVVDADLGMANLAAVLGLQPGATLHDVLAGRADLDEAVVEARGGDLVVLPGDRELAGFADADPGALGDVLAALAEERDYVVVDTGAGLSYEDVLPLGLADAVVLVTTPDPAAVGDTRKTLELSGLVSGSVLGVVVTRAREDTDAQAVAAEIGADLLGVVPEDPAVTESTAGGGPLESSAPDAPATAAYRELAASVEVGVDALPSAGGAPAADSSSAEPVAADDGPEDDTGNPDGGATGEAAPRPDDAVAEGDAGDDPPDDGEESEEDEAADEAQFPDDDGEPADEGPSDDADADDGDDQPDASEGDESTGDEPDDEAAEADADDEAGDDDETEDAVAEAEDAADGGGEDEAARRGGLLGWLGRRF